MNSFLIFIVTIYFTLSCIFVYVSTTEHSPREFTKLQLLGLFFLWGPLMLVGMLRELVR